jgi:radical SAM superfamily enzyme YgiQ (UPF0313 family)
MTVLLINPWYVSRETSQRQWPAEPLGLLSLATFLGERSFAVPHVLDAHMAGPSETQRDGDGWRSGMTDVGLELLLLGYKPDLVGITANYTFGAANALAVARVVKNVNPDIPVLLGGAHATLDAWNLAHLPEVNMVARGEGEETLLDLVKSGLNPTGVRGLTYRDKGGVVSNADRLQIQDLDTLPVPDRSYVNYWDYLRKPGYFHTRQRPVGTMFTSRGCPFRCQFCSTHVSWGHTWRGRSAAAMVREAQHLRDRYGVREIAFQDDQFLGDPQRIIDFCRLAIDRKLGLTFTVPPGNSPCRMSRELLDEMARAGFYRLCFSVDAGTQETARRIKKPVHLDKIRPLVRHANRRGIWTYGTFVIGHPGETAEDIRRGIRYAYSLGLDFLRFYIAQPHLGSDLFHYWESRGKIDRATLLQDHNIMGALFGTDEVSAPELERLRNDAELGYLRRHLLRFLNPWYLLIEFLPKLMGPARLYYAVGLLCKGWRIRTRYRP